MLNRWFVPLTVGELLRLRVLLNVADPTQAGYGVLVRKLDGAIHHIQRWNTRREARDRGKG